MWTIWKYAIGSFSDEKTADYDNHVAIIRTLVVFVNFVTCFFIMANVIHNWWDMSEYTKIKEKQAEQLGSIDNVHPMKQVAVMSLVQFLMLLGVGITMFLIGLNVWETFGLRNIGPRA